MEPLGVFHRAWGGNEIWPWRWEGAAMALRDSGLLGVLPVFAIPEIFIKI